MSVLVFVGLRPLGCLWRLWRLWLCRLLCSMRNRARAALKLPASSRSCFGFLSEPDNESDRLVRAARLLRAIESDLLSGTGNLKLYVP